MVSIIVLLVMIKDGRFFLIAYYAWATYYPVSIFDVDSTLNRRRNFDGRRKSVKKCKNISTVVEKALKFWRQINVDISTVVEKRKNISTSKFARWVVTLKWWNFFAWITCHLWPTMPYGLGLWHYNPFNNTGKIQLTDYLEINISVCKWLTIL